MLDRISAQALQQPAPGSDVLRIDFTNIAPKRFGATSGTKDAAPTGHEEPLQPSLIAPKRFGSGGSSDKTGAPSADTGVKKAATAAVKKGEPGQGTALPIDSPQVKQPQPDSGKSADKTNILNFEDSQDSGNVYKKSDLINNSRLGFYGEIAHDTSLALTTAMASTRIGSPYTGYLPTQNWLPKLARLSLSSTTVDYLPAAHNVKRPPTVSNGLAAESESLEMITHQELGQALALQNADYRLATNSTRMTRRQVSAGVGEVLPFLAAEAITRVCDASTSQPIGPVSVAIKTAGPLLVGFSGRAKIGGIPSTTFAAGAYAAGYCASRLLDKQIDPVDWTMSGNYKRGPLFGTYIDQLLGLDTK